MKKWYSSIYQGFIYTGLISILIGYFSDTNVYLGAFIAGYSAILLSILMLLTIILYNLLNAGSKPPVSKFFFTLAPFIIMLMNISFLIYLLAKYSNEILSGHVSNSFFTFNNIVSLLTGMQLYVITNMISYGDFDSDFSISTKISLILILLSVLVIVSTRSIYVILADYVTDGFRIK